MLAMQLNTSALSLSFTINCNQNIIYNTPNYAKVVRKNTETTGYGVIQYIQYEFYPERHDIQESLEYRETYTIVKIQQTITTTNFSLYINNYWAGSDQEIATQWNIETSYITGQNNQLDAVLNRDRNTISDHWEDDIYTMEMYSSYNEVDRDIKTDSQGDTNSFTAQNLQTSSNRIYYYVMYNGLTSQNHEQFTGTARLQNGYIENTLDFNYTVLVDTENYEVIDLGGLMFEILGMPFTFISTAFNLTLFAGTPYQIVVSDILFAVIGALMIIFIIRKFTKWQQY